MKRHSKPLAALVFLGACLPLGLAQGPPNQPSFALPSDILGSQLIAWSQLQKPQPIPQPLSMPSRSAQPSDQPPQAANPSAQPQFPAEQAFTGTIIKDGLRYVLKVSSNSVYQLDDQERAGLYEGKQVKIAGTLDATGNSLHVTSIELVS